jgi:uncharacterized membrane protein/sporulation protein YlmC with PRC-barrel domain
MQSIPLNAHVACADGPCGTSVAVIVDPETLKPTHVVVKGKERPHTQWLVPVEEVAESSSDSIRLQCGAEALAGMSPFVVKAYRQISVPRYTGPDMAAPVYTPNIQTLEVDRQMIPEGEVAVRYGMEVVATDGPVGTVHELVSDPDTGQITHFVLREGHPWDRADVVLPLSVISSVGREKIFLTLDQETIGYLLSIPARWHAGEAAVELVVFTTAEAGTAKEARKALEASAKAEDLEVLNVAVLVKDKEGKASVAETEDVSSRHGALFGAITGGLLGLIGGPAGVVLGAAAGAATGGIAAGRLDMGFSDAYLAKVGENLQPGSSALVILVEPGGAEKVSAVLDGFSGEVVRQSITDAMMAQIAAQTAAQSDSGAEG